MSGYTWVNKKPVRILAGYTKANGKPVRILYGATKVNGKPVRIDLGPQTVTVTITYNARPNNRFNVKQSGIRLEAGTYELPIGTVLNIATLKGGGPIILNGKQVTDPYDMTITKNTSMKETLQVISGFPFVTFTINEEGVTP